MCCCATPNVNGNPGYSWDGKNVSMYPVNPPAIEDDVLLFDEPGRCGGMDCHSHHFRLVKHYGSTMLLVHHGGGDERIRVSLPRGFTFDSFDSNTRYWLFHAIYYAHSDGHREGTDKAASTYRHAFVDGRLKKRKLPAQGSVKVWIEPPAASKNSAAEDFGPYLSR